MRIPEPVDTSRESAPQNWFREIEQALARGEWSVLDAWLARTVAVPANPQEFTDLCHLDNPAACLFNALFFRLPDHQHLHHWAERARQGLETLPPSARLTLARRLIYYDAFFGRPARATLLLDSLRDQGMERLRAPVLQLQWGLLCALGADVNGAHADCIEIVRRSQDLAIRHGILQWSAMLRSLEIAACLGLNDMPAARHAWDTPLPEESRHGLLGTAHLHQLGAQLALADGELALAREHTEAALATTARAGVPLFHALACLAAAEVCLQQERCPHAEDLLQRAERVTRNTDSVQLSCLAQLVRASLALRHGTRERMHEYLRGAFGLAARHGYRNFFWWSPRMLQELCAAALTDGIEIAYLRDLVQTRRLAPDAAAVHIEHWPWPVRIYTLGRFTVLVDHTPVRSRRKAQHKPLELLKALIAQGGRDVGEDTLIELLWPDAEGDAARRAFDVTLHRLRKLLGNDQAVLLHERKLSLNNRLCWVDSWALERLLSETEAILADPHADPQGSALARYTERIQALYHGPFLGKDFAAAWAISQRERLRSRYLRHVTAAGARWQQLHQWDRAVECYRKGLEVDDLAEQLYQNLMRCHLQLGQRSEALGVYRRCRFMLSTVLGISPSPATESLYRQLRADA
jgi:LuxR family maltose regulon positive regulatory protein